MVPRTSGPAEPPRANTTGSSRDSDRFHPGRASGPVVRYDEGPTKRISPPRTSTSSKPGAVTPSVPKSRPASGGPASGGTVSGGKTDAGQTSSPTKGPGLASAREVKGWRDIRRSDPQAAKEIFVATSIAGRAHEVAVGVAVGAIGGVYAGGFRGGLDHHNDPWVSDPWGWRGWSSCSSFWTPGIWSWCGWSYALYWSCYYPTWWWSTRPYYYADYCYYPATSVVYSSPQVIYVEGSNDPVETYVSDPAPSGAPAHRIAPAVPEANPLSIAAQRYLELGDRAFREERYTDAVQFYAKAVEFAPDQGALYLVLSDALFAAGDYHYGAYAVRRAIELDPALVESNVDKHGFYPDPSRFDEQLAMLERYSNEHPSDRDARLVLALNYLFGGRAADSARVIESSFSDMGQDPAALKILERALAVRD